MSVEVRFKKLQEDAKIPVYQTDGAAGMDLHCVEYIWIKPGKTKVVQTGLAIQVPEGYEAQVRSRSGLAKEGVFVPNSPGTVDSDYRGPLGVLLYNGSETGVTFQPGDRIAQLVIAPVVQVETITVKELDETERGSGGFGHTGVS